MTLLCTVCQRETAIPSALGDRVTRREIALACPDAAEHTWTPGDGPRVGSALDAAGLACSAFVTAQRRRALHLIAEATTLRHEARFVTSEVLTAAYASCEGRALGRAHAALLAAYDAIDAETRGAAR